MMDIAIVFNGLNLALLLVLLFLYGRILLRTKARHSLGLFVFAFLLFLNSALTIYSYVVMAFLFGAEVVPFLSGIAVLEFAGLVILLRLTL